MFTKEEKNELELCQRCGIDLGTPGEIVDEFKLCHECYCVVMDKTCN